MNRYDHLDKAALVRLLEKRDAERQLGLVWERDELDADAAANQDYVALDLDEGLSHGDAPWDNLIIEGDNLDALRALRASHAGRIRLTYIDPPYNTGNRDFVYNDRYVDKNHRFRHSLWLEFMYQRLTLARDLLADDGVIFVSIDDNELFRLGMLMDRVFGTHNKLGCFVWQTDGNFDNQAKVKIAHEYILAYSPNVTAFPMPTVVDPNVGSESKLHRSEIRNTIVKNGPKNPISDIELPPGFPASFEAGVIEAREDSWPHFLTAAEVMGGKLLNKVTVRSGWANRGLCEQFIRHGCVPIKDSRGQETRFALTRTGAVENIKRRKVPSHVVSVLRNLGNTQSDSAMLAGLGVDFTYPKPVSMMQYLLSILDDKNATVLDFFAGSGTTAHAVAKLNAEDGGQRRFIMVSNSEATEAEPDKNLCRDVCAERVRRVMAGYSDARGRGVDGLGGGFAYLRTRRMAPHRLITRIRHGEVWHALQRVHGRPLTPFRERGFQHDGRVGYLVDTRAASLDALRDWLGDSDGAGHTIYTWVPERTMALAPQADIAALPDFLLRRFGG